MISPGKHVMLSYNSNSQDIVSKIHQILQGEHIPLWFDRQGDMKDDMYDSLAEGVENAAVIVSFMTLDYEKSNICKLELQYAQKRHKKIIPCILNDTNAWKPSDWLELIIREHGYVDFCDVSESNIHSKLEELIDRIETPSLASQYVQSQSVDKLSYLFELIRYEYVRNSRIERLMNPAKSFPIDQTYINLAIVAIKEQQETEKKLRDTRRNDAIIGTYEEIYGTKTPINVSDIFKTCKDLKKNVLVFGRAGIGKSTFCRHVAYRWAKGEIWSEYELIILISLRCLTESRYPRLPHGTRYSLIDLVKREYFPHRNLSKKEEEDIKDQLGKDRVLWLLDGYDEVVQNIPEYLESLLEQLLKTSHHIITSRPYFNTLFCPVQMEITGFTNENIVKYVEQFFNQIKDELPDASSQGQKLLKFLESVPSIWGIAHIPVNLELICSLWGDNDWSETKTLTITALYDKITQWLCRRYLTKQKNMKTQGMTKNALHKHCQQELAFLETVAFHAMQDNTIILRSKLLEKAEKENDCLLADYPQLLNIGILKSLNDRSTGSYIETDRQHYFVHLSFQEHFAARYLVTALNGPTSQKAINFIKRHKYNERFALVFSFAAGLLMESDNEQCIDRFWDAIQGEPLDLVGLRHTQLIIYCLEETIGMPSFRQRNELLYSISKWIKIVVSMEHHYIREQLTNSLKRATSLIHEPYIQGTFIELLQSEHIQRKLNVLSMISKLPISNPSSQLVDLLLAQSRNSNIQDEQSNSRFPLELIGPYGDRWSAVDLHRDLKNSALNTLHVLADKATTDDIINELLTRLKDENADLRRTACIDLRRMGETAVTNDVINGLVTALGDVNHNVRKSACSALEAMGEKAVTNDVINGLVTALGDTNDNVRESACSALETMGEKAVTKDVINGLVTALEDKNDNIRKSACSALKTMGEKAVTNNVINGLVTALGDQNYYVRMRVCDVFCKMGEKAATNDVINGLAIALGDENGYVRWHACSALQKMGEKASTNDVINRLVTALGDENEKVRSSAYQALQDMGEKAATNDVINRIMTALQDENNGVRASACLALGEMGKQAATNDMINRLVTALGDVNYNVRRNACLALGKMGEKAVINDVINGLLTALGDVNHDVRRGACSALWEIGEKAATNDVINALVNALGDENDNVRDYACKALGEMYEKAATMDVINRLVAALGDVNHNVRKSACAALWKVGEKAATNDVINGLTTALSDNDHNVIYRACLLLSEMGEKAATNEVINKLLSAVHHPADKVSDTAYNALDSILCSVSSLTNLHSNTIERLFSQILHENLWIFAHIHLEDFVKVFFDTKESAWLPVITIIALRREISVTVNGNTIALCSGQEPVEVQVVNEELRQQFVEAFDSQLRRLQSSTEVGIEPENAIGHGYNVIL